MAQKVEKELKKIQIKVETDCSHDFLAKTGSGEVTQENSKGVVILEKWQDFQCVCCKKTFRFREK